MLSHRACGWHDLPGHSSTPRCFHPGPALQMPYKIQPVPQWAGTPCPNFLQQSEPLPIQEKIRLFSFFLPGTTMIIMITN
jgi:hypothetical protein